MKRILIAAIRFYQQFLSPVFSSGACRFYPSCSQFAIDAVSKYGPIGGVARSMRRILKCHPFHPGGYDPA